MSILNNVENEIESTGERLEEEVATGITEVDHPVILSEVHAFFDNAKTKVAEVFHEIVAKAKSTEEAIEDVILAAVGKAADESKTLVTEITSS